ncbi:helix-turn-helix transcriptional regulator [Curtobacterium sp. VKM Ac-1376]|uniref:helix-turn-helix transcriptional regulator n=1 Tax=Curtobacterium sp. VKM Ac-1376 TaxID=123312 RepID=UPI001889D420|nr:AraC family transcriptional regulator [Curtobacterium sp. VKM Ac-1376]MBF4616040.1 AraC family transcriptional regulator [Curtobacterium sp. VKM Ac-1376]
MLTAVHGTEDARTVTARIDGRRRRTERSGTDPVFAAGVLARAGHGRDVVFDTEDDRFRLPFRFRYRTRRDGHVSLVTVAVTSGFSGVFESADRVIVGWSSTGGVRIALDGAVVLESRPAAPVLMPTVGTFSVHAPKGTLQLVSIDRVLVDRVSERLRGTAPVLPVRGAEPDREALEVLRRSVEAVAVTVTRDGATREARAGAQVALVEAVLGAFGARDADVALRSVAPSTVELAEAYLDGHCGQVLCLADICDAVGVSPRTLQTSFMREHGVSPMTFLQRMRLDRVHAALQSGNRHETSVSEVAVEWGFRHLGRFSGTYFRRFGEYPGQTLRASSGRCADGPERRAV